MPRKSIPGAIMIISCHKYFQSRVLGNTYSLSGPSLCGWPIIYVVGDPNMDSLWKLDELTSPIKGFILTVKSEDFYTHLFKKIVLAQGALHKIYNIEYGIIKCDDDILFNLQALEKFIAEPPTAAFMARRYDTSEPLQDPGPHHCLSARFDSHMPMYFYKNSDQLAELQVQNPHFNPNDYTRIPDLPPGAGGPEVSYTYQLSLQKCWLTTSSHVIIIFSISIRRVSPIPLSLRM